MSNNAFDADISVVRKAVAIGSRLIVPILLVFGSHRISKIVERNHIEKWFQTLKNRTDRFHTT